MYKSQRISGSPEILQMALSSVVLQAPNHTDSVMTELQILQKEQILCDVRLNTDTGGVSAHRIVLMATCPSMRSRLASGDMSNEFIHFDNVPLNLLETVVHFMYTGKLSVEGFSINQLLKFCEDIALTSAVDLLKDHIKNVIVSSALQRTEKDSTKKDASDSQYKTESEDGAKTDSKRSASRRSNRRVKQTPKKRTAKNSAIQATIPEKLVKLSSEVLIQKVIAQGFVKEEPEPAEHRGRGRPKKKTLRAPTKVTKAAKRKAAKPKCVSKKGKKKTKPEKESGMEYNSDGEKIFPTAVPTERLIRTRTEVNALKAVIARDAKPETETKRTSASPLPAELKEPKKEIVLDDDESQNYSGDTETEQGFMDYIKDEMTKLKKKKKQVWKRRTPQPCSMCDKVLSTKKRLVFHEFCQHGIEYDKTKYKMFHCPVEGCGHVSSSRNNLRTHSRSRHMTERPHICEFCGKAFKLQNVLATHRNLHTGAKVFECKKCGERFNQHAGLDVHIKRYHMGESSWGELCHLCSEKFLHKSDLCWHLFRIHDQPLPDKYKAYTCDKCDFVTKKAQDFERHKNAHAGIKEWVCHICSKGCATKSELKRHVMYHGEKKFKCSFENCTYACVDDLGLQKHIQLNHTHKHFKPYVCSVCKYKTGVKGNLDKHIRQVHNLEVVSKHTVPLKMKYKDFQQGDIITKEGQLVVSVQDREQLYKEELQRILAEKGEITTHEDTRIRQINKTRKSSLERAKPNMNQNVSKELSLNTVSDATNIIAGAAESVSASSKIDSEYTIPQQPQVEKYQNSLPMSQSNSFQMDAGTPLFGSHIYSHNQTIPPHMALGLGGTDLRMSLAAHLAGPHLYPEDLQAYVTDGSLEHVEMK